MKQLPIVGFGLAALCVVAAAVLSATGSAVPGWFEQLAIFAAGGSAGAIIPTAAAHRRDIPPAA